MLKNIIKIHRRFIVLENGLLFDLHTIIAWTYTIGTSI